MKHDNRIFNILYMICACLTLTAIARPLLSQRAIPAIASASPPAASIDPAPSDPVPADIRRTALTFDDGPHPVYTEQLLDGLKERGVKATFFVTGEHAELHPDIIRRMHEEGHLIGNHTYSHIQLTTANRDKFKNELIQTNEILYDIPVLWNVDPLDWNTANAGRVASAVINKVSDNDIILLHDYYDTSVEAALMIIDELMQQGYEFVTVDKILFD